MKELKTFGLAVYMEEATNELVFGDGVFCENSNKKMLHQMKGLLYDDSAANEKNEVCYIFYADITCSKDRMKFKEKGFTNGITVLMPGTMKGECRKNSGHYHGYVKGHTLTFPEAYEVLIGEAVFLLQKSTNFDRPQEELQVQECKAVFLKPGEKIIVPPFYAHCAVNVGEGPMAFGNMAAPCPLLYEPIRSKHGFFNYVLKKDGKIIFIPNSRYQNLPQLHIAEAKENSKLGIVFDIPMYESFVKNPSRFEFLCNPEAYLEDIESMLV